MIDWIKSFFVKNNETTKRLTPADADYTFLGLNKETWYKKFDEVYKEKQRVYYKSLTDTPLELVELERKLEREFDQCKADTYFRGLTFKYDNTVLNLVHIVVFTYSPVIFPHILEVPLNTLPTTYELDVDWNGCYLPYSLVMQYVTDRQLSESDYWVNQLKVKCETTKLNFYALDGNEHYFEVKNPMIAQWLIKEIENKLTLCRGSSKL